MRISVSILMACAVLLAAVARGQISSTDDLDGDGIENVMDECTDTEPGDLIDADGCTICPCEETADGAAWASHQAYVQCVTAEAKRRLRSHVLKKKAMREIVKDAKAATCGNEELTRCCMYADETDTVGRCKVMSVDKCDELWEESDFIEDEGPGSCKVNPCAF